MAKVPFTPSFSFAKVKMVKVPPKPSRFKPKFKLVKVVKRAKSQPVFHPFKPGLMIVKMPHRSPLSMSKMKTAKVPSATRCAQVSNSVTETPRAARPGTEPAPFA